jgi:hypothetical protein
LIVGLGFSAVFGLLIKPTPHKAPVLASAKPLNNQVKAQKAVTPVDAPKPQPVQQPEKPAPASPPAPAPVIPPPPADPKAYAASVLDAVQYGCLVSLWNGESGWRVDAYNPSGAYGIPQALPGSKMASAGADWQTNPVTQVKWGLSYIAAVYGSPCNAFNTWLSRYPHWY